jgi:uncharacterized flavoprotein (TIGR03862 family)
LEDTLQTLTITQKSEPKLHYDILIVGAGPAGLMAAEHAALAGFSVAIADAMPSPARKFLMAGKSGLNLTKQEDTSTCIKNYDAIKSLRPILEEFGPKEVISFAEGLGQEVFTGSTGRVFPKVMKASPLLRAWLARLETLGVTLLCQHRWVGPLVASESHSFKNPAGDVQIQAKALILAMGGASWARLGSDGAWSKDFTQAGISQSEFVAANVGIQVAWSQHMGPYFGKPLKNIKLSVAGAQSRGEFVISKSGIEGGAVYALGPMLRKTAIAKLDFAPQINTADLHKMITSRKPKDSLTNFLRKSVKLDATKRALVFELTQPMPRDVNGLVAAIKNAPLPLMGPCPMDQAISTAGGVMWDALTPELMLKTYPGIFCAGEMVDWEAPTGGYLITACLATGRWAGRAVADYLSTTARL